MSWRELYDRYDELKDLSEEELTEKLGDWWAHIFLDSKDEIGSGLWRRDKN